MQLIAEVYQLLKEIAGMSNDELHDIFSNWNDGQLRSYLIEITAAIFAQKDDLTQNYLIDMILDSAHQKGTGKWMSQNAMDLQVPVPAIDAAVSARDLSAYKNERITASQKLKGPVAVLVNNKNEFVKLLEQALYFSIITTYSQGISLLHQASKEYKYDMKPEEVVKIWRGGCIIRASVLESIRSAFQLNPDLPNLMIDKVMAEKLMTCREGLKSVVKLAVDNGIPIPGLMASMAYYDGYRKGRLPSGLLQAQRDFFGAHTYQRIDREGDFHTQWNQKI
jgi:6-phosphogluconate dehydrogenase